MKDKSILKQIKNNSVALISLFIAISSLSYNTWRNEKTEENRNQRHAAFEILVTLNKLQQVVFHHYYDQDIKNKGNLRTGWTLVLNIDDFSKLLNPSLQSSINSLHGTWEENWQTIGINQASIDITLEAIDKVRIDILSLLKNLN